MCSFRTIRKKGCPYTNNYESRKAKEKEKVGNPQSAAHLKDVESIDCRVVVKISDQSISAFPDHGGSALASNHVVPDFKLM